MKKITIVLLVLLLTPLFSFAEAITLQEVEELFANPQQWQEPPTDNSEGYTCPAVRISDLWKKLGIVTRLKYLDSEEYMEGDSYLFGCKSTGSEECILQNPEARLYGSPKIRILRISGNITGWDYQLFLFRKEGDQWLYFGNIGLPTEKYREPEIKFLSDELFSVVSLGSHGTGNLSYYNLIYTISDNKLKRVLFLPHEGEWWGWNMMFNHVYKSKFYYWTDALYCYYDIAITANAESTYHKIESDEETFPLFKIKRQIAFTWDGSEFIFNKDKSTLTAEELEKLQFGGNEDYYKLFKGEFDKLKEGNKRQQEWYKLFMKELEGS